MAQAIRENNKNKVGPKWEKGIWLGNSRESNETLVGTKGGVIRCYSIKRMPSEEKWQKDQVLELQGTPQQPNPSRSGLRIPIRLEVDGEASGGASGPSPAPPDGDVPPIPEDIPDPLVRRTPITFREVEKYGPTPNCVGCEAKTRGEVTR